MIDSMLVRARDGKWERLSQTAELPDGGVIELFGEDLAPIVGASQPVVVAACSPSMTSAAPDAICVDTSGGIWIVQLDLAGGGDAMVPNLLAAGGELADMDRQQFETLCARRGELALAEHVASLAHGLDIDVSAVEEGIRSNLDSGRFQLVAIVKDASASLLQPMRFLNQNGASGHVLEAVAYASDSVLAMTARSIDVGGRARRERAAAPDPASAPASEASQPAEPVEPAAAEHEPSAASFMSAVGAAAGTETAALVSHLQEVCVEVFDAVEYRADSEACSMHAVVNAGSGEHSAVIVGADGSIVLSFEAIAELDRTWAIRDDLCQGMERLLGTDLGEVRSISKLNLTVAEHLMDLTLMEALGELLRDTMSAVADAGEHARSRARRAVAA